MNEIMLNKKAYQLNKRWIIWTALRMIIVYTMISELRHWNIRFLPTFAAMNVDPVYCDEFMIT